MYIYHGSNVIVDKPKIVISNRFLDFGNGFYTTTNYEQAINFADKVTFRRKEGQSIVNIYSFDETKLKDLSILKFDKPNEQWLDFVYNNRVGKTLKHKYDLIIGPVANDDVYQTFTLYANGIITKEQTIQILKVKKLYNQYVFSTEKAISYIIFKKAEYGKK